MDAISYIKSHEFDAYSIHPSEEYLNQSLIKEAHDNGYKVLCYTVNDKEIADIFKPMGVDGIISNYPDILQK